MSSSTEDKTHFSTPSQPPLTFFSLFQELRDHCYSLALTIPTPIIAWSGASAGNEAEYRSYFLKDDLQNAKEYKATTSSVRALLPNLLRCNSKVAYEAASIFYGRNRFLFLGDWTWETVLSWWEKIGQVDRGFITLLELRIRRPLRAYERPDRERIDDPMSLEPASSRSPYLSRSSDSTADGYIETLNPAIEEFFKLLDDPLPSTRKLSITISLHTYSLPELRLLMGEIYRWDYYNTIDLPNLMEKLREKTYNVEVLWKGFVNRDRFLAEKANLERL
ncbi:hypothetical protein BGZ60DRAFT_395073 [Tricladium varicosporioides]|nr:hypothetical protein BGZ60DRAFT_395073 [Hymenoscyphus varicosporioides]